MRDSVEARGQFHRVVIQSGGPHPGHPTEFAPATRQAVTRSLGTKDTAR
ncbi:hypothetical protein [Streptomyces massasporeus]